MSRDSYGATDFRCVFNIRPKTRGLQYSGRRDFGGTFNPYQRSVAP
jgi:hypothetical protein